MKTSGNNPTSEHRGSCRVYYAEGVCTCGAPLERERALRLARERWARLRDWLVARPRFGLGVAIITTEFEDAFNALAADLEAAERKAKELGRLADDEGSRRMSAERERDDLLRQRVELQNSIGGYVVQVDKLCEQRAKAWRDLATAREALDKIEAYRTRPVDHPTLAFAEVVEIARDALRSLGEKA